MSDKMYSVFDREGKEHRMTWPNARDVVRNCGWTMTPGVIVHPIPEGVKPADTEEARAKQLTVVEIAAPKEPTDTYAGVDKSLLQDFAEAAEITFDKRWNEKRLVLTIETALDARLTESGDTAGSIDDEDGNRRVRAYRLEVEARNIDVAEDASLKDLIKTLADSLS